ncbi:MAG: DUF4429 domain-containing protein [Actinomycetota bacterium]|nr:DUF4429 domain-containing protein [Actinomycetota bacterium]
MLTGKGVNGQVEVDGEWITIRRKGAMAKMSQGLKGDKRIPIANVQAVQFKKAGLTNGYLQFTLAGGVESRGGVFDATKDENTVMFTGRHKAEFEAIRDYVEDSITRRLGHGDAPGVDVAGQLEKLALLRDQGVLSEAEFDGQKSKLLGS